MMPSLQLDKSFCVCVCGWGRVGGGGIFLFLFIKVVRLAGSEIGTKDFTKPELA